MGKGVPKSSSSQPTLTASPSPVKETTEDVVQAGVDEKKKLKKMQGYESTLLKSPGLGDGGKVQTQRNALLGQ